MKKISFFKTILLSLIISVLSFSFVSAKTVIRTDEAAIGEADPAKFSDNIDSIIMFNTYDALVDEGKNGGGLVPLLASGWEYADATTLNINLKNGIIDYQFNASVNATPNVVLNILSNHKYLPQLNKHIKSTTQESIGTKTIRIFKLEKCILNFCFDLNFEEEISIRNSVPKHLRKNM